MTPSALIADLEQRLVRLRAGQRFWFRASPDTPAGQPPVLLTSFAEDPRATQLGVLASGIRLPETALETLGVGAVDDEGRLALGGPLLRPRILSALAAFVRGSRTAHPGLDRFWGTRLLRISAGRVVEEHSVPDLWEGIQRPVVAGTLAHTASQLAALSPGERAWAWLVARGPAGTPHLAIESCSTDEDGRDLAAQVSALRRRGAEGWSLSGVLIRHPEWMAWTTAADPDGWRPVVESLVESRPDLASLRTLRVISLQSTPRVERLAT